MTKQEIQNSAPLLRSGFISLVLFALSFYIGYRMSDILGGRSFSSVDPFIGCVSAYDFAVSWINLVCPAMIGFLLIFASVFSPFCPLISAAVVIRQAFCCGLMFDFLSPECASLFVAELFSALAVTVLSAISLSKFHTLRRISFRRGDPLMTCAVKYVAEFLLISGFAAFVYLPAAIISHIF